VILALAACGGAPAKPALPAQRFVDTPAPAALDRKTKALAVLPKVQELLAERAKSFPSLAVGIVVGRELVWSRGYGARTDAGKEEVTASTVFRIGSITKAFTGAAALMLRDGQQLQFDAPAAETLRELGGIGYPTRDSPAVTFRHLMTHCSGLPRDGSYDPDSAATPVTEEELLADVGKRTLSFAPGSEDAYSNLAYAVVGAAIHRITGTSYENFVTERLLRPLGMSATVWDDAHVAEGKLAAGHRRAGEKLVPATKQWKLGAYSPAGGLYSSVEDMAKWVSFELGAWPPRSDPETGPLPRKTVRESQLTFGPARSGRATFGVGWVVYEEQGIGNVVFHNGATADYAATVWLSPRRQVGVVALAGSGDSAPLDAVGREVLAMMAQVIPEPVRPFGPPVKAALDRVLKLLDNPDEEGVKGAFSPSFLKQVSPGGVVETFKKIHADLGTCREVEPLVVPSDNEAAARVTCANGAFMLSISVTPAEPYLIEILVPKPIQ
jgi:CubicO group peptidase (beta-lactamase class C family)